VIGSATTTEARAQPLVDIVRAGILTVSHTVLIRVLVRHATATDTFLSLIWIGSTVIETVNDTITVGIIISDITTTESRA
jgi:broad specificity phosphatase PhoE